MKVVAFKNGKYGVRKWSFGGYLFAVNKSGYWEYRSIYKVQEFDSIEFANEVLEYMKECDKRSRDKGS